MERLTEYHGGKAVIKDKNELGQAMEKLAKYEDIDGEIRKAIAWQPLPEPYKPKKTIPATEHIMSRFMKVE